MSAINWWTLGLALCILLWVFRALDAPWWLGVTGVAAYGFLVLLAVNV